MIMPYPEAKAINILSICLARLKLCNVWIGGMQRGFNENGSGIFELMLHTVSR